MYRNVIRRTFQRRWNWLMAMLPARKGETSLISSCTEQESMKHWEFCVIDDVRDKPLRCEVRLDASAKLQNYRHRNLVAICQIQDQLSDDDSAWMHGHNEGQTCTGGSPACKVLHLATLRACLIPADCTALVTKHGKDALDV